MTLALQGTPPTACSEHELVAAVRRGDDRAFEVLFSRYEQRITAYLYLGATFVSLNQPDSAVVYYRAAVERDPFADLDPRTFTEAERQVFADARQRAFNVGVRPIEATEIDPRGETIVIEAVSTHDAELRIEVSHTRRQLRFPIFEGENDGLRQVPWSGALPDGALVPPGTYRLIVTGGSLLLRGRIDSASVLFDVRHQFEPLEDTLRSLAPDELLPVRRPSSTARNELLIGLGVATRNQAKDGVAVSIAFGLILAFFYWTLYSFCMSLGYGEKLPPFIAAWSANLVFICFGGYLMLNSE